VGGNLNYSSRVQCACAWYPPTDLNHLVTDPKARRNPKNMVAKLIGGPVEDNIAKADFASPITYVDTNCAPVFLMHGGADTLVPPSQSELFYHALTNAGVEVHLEIIPKQGHGIIAPEPVADEMGKFFQAHLSGG
jgi:dipeptidyl aminopeptidase/acylaminoacyl peptidase